MKTIGIIAGNGRFPLLALKEARREGYRIAVCAIEKEADAGLSKMADSCQWVKVGELKKMVKFFRAEGVHEAIMAGKIEKVRLFQENVKPDLEMLKVVMKTRDFKDDSLLSGIANYLHSEGIDLMDSTIFMRDALPKGGVLGKRKPSKENWEDLKFGYRMAKGIAALDIGQTVIVKKKAVLAVEAIEGTDAAIHRAAALGDGKITVVKVAKPNQDMRFDVPAVGLRTLKSLVDARAEAFGFEAGKTIFLDREEVLEKADKAGIAMVGLVPEDAKEL